MKSWFKLVLKRMLKVKNIDIDIALHLLPPSDSPKFDLSAARMIYFTVTHTFLVCSMQLLLHAFKFSLMLHFHSITPDFNKYTKKTNKNELLVKYSVKTYHCSKLKQIDYMKYCL